ncbi:MAG: cyclic nucleotide-binding domain-containing protein [Candidatus Schekmanbacteria bacterium]|nr:cyclic nucleotide-binding domain-containing protein [Candidatus Schekmanbacteria bacterium]
MASKWVDQLRNYVLFRELSDEELELIAKATKEESYQADEVLFNYGEKGGNLYLISEGMIEITIPIMRFDSKEERVSLLKEGDCFGELSFFDNKPHSARATAIKPVKVVVINNNDYERNIKENLEAGYEVQKKILAKIVNIVRDMNTRYSYKPFLE